MSVPRRIYFINHCTGFFDWRTYDSPPKLEGQCSWGCKVITYERVSSRRRVKTTLKKRVKAK